MSFLTVLAVENLHILWNKILERHGAAVKNYVKSKIVNRILLNANVKWRNFLVILWRAYTKYGTEGITKGYEKNEKHI